jgi:hypothetical protein
VFSRSYSTIKDKKFDIFDGLRVHMLAWIILGHCYVLGDVYGATSKFLKVQIYDWIPSQIVVSSDFAVSFLYFMSGFIGMFGLIKKFQQSNENVA